MQFISLYESLKSVKLVFTNKKGEVVTDMDKKFNILKKQNASTPENLIKVNLEEFKYKQESIEAIIEAYQHYINLVSMTDGTFEDMANKGEYYKKVK